jgi:hypothetical protein
MSQVIQRLRSSSGLQLRGAEVRVPGRRGPSLEGQLYFPVFPLKPKEWVYCKQGRDAKLPGQIAGGTRIRNLVMQLGRHVMPIV